MLINQHCATVFCCFKMSFGSDLSPWVITANGRSSPISVWLNMQSSGGSSYFESIKNTFAFESRLKADSLKRSFF